MRYTELILKVTSICNLNCHYCYVFNKGDDSYKFEANFLSFKLCTAILDRLVDHCSAHGIKNFLIIFHGGEPLMVNPQFYKNFVELFNANKAGISFKYGIQTNATLLTQEWIDILSELNIQIGISIDGTRESSIHRVFRGSNQEAYDSIMRGALLIKKNKLPLCTLSVMNPEVSAKAIYEHLKMMEVDFADFLYPDITYDTQPVQGLDNWLIELFDCWYNDVSEKPVIRYFDLMIKILLGQSRGNEVLGCKENKTLCIKTNGNIDIVDSLKVCGNRFTHTGYNVLQNSISVLDNDLNLRTYYHAHHSNVLCKQCRDCEVLEICGGGKLAHRYSKLNGFNNPSAYCQCSQSIIKHVSTVLYSDLSQLQSTSYE